MNSRIAPSFPEVHCVCCVLASPVSSARRCQEEDSRFLSYPTYVFSPIPLTNFIKSIVIELSLISVMLLKLAKKHENLLGGD